MAFRPSWKRKELNLYKNPIYFSLPAIFPSVTIINRDNYKDYLWPKTKGRIEAHINVFKLFKGFISITHRCLKLAANRSGRFVTFLEEPTVCKYWAESLRLLLIIKHCGMRLLLYEDTAEWVIYRIAMRIRFKKWT